MCKYTKIKGKFGAELTEERRIKSLLDGDCESKRGSSRVTWASKGLPVYRDAKN